MPDDDLPAQTGRSLTLAAAICLSLGALQQYTADKRKLHAAVDRIQWNFQSRTGLSAGGVPSTMTRGVDGAVNIADALAPIAGAAPGGSAIDSIRRLAFIAGAMRLLPGRKSMVLFAETNVVPLTVAGLRDTDATPAVQQAIEQMLDVSSRASVGIYCIDPRGLMMGLTDPAQEGMRYLSQATGALAFGSFSSDLSIPLAMVLEDQKGYYLLGYTPDTLSFDLLSGKRKFHTIAIRTNRSGLSVRSHAGFAGAEGAETPAPVPGSTDAVVASLASPFGSPEIQVGMTSLFFNTAMGGSSITTLVNFKAGDLSFREGAGGLREATGDIAVLARPASSSTCRNSKRIVWRSRAFCFRCL